jgi:hypothetical protein
MWWHWGKIHEEIGTAKGVLCEESYVVKSKQIGFSRLMFHTVNADKVYMRYISHTALVFIDKLFWYYLRAIVMFSKKKLI